MESEVHSPTVASKTDNEEDDQLSINVTNNISLTLTPEQIEKLENSRRRITNSISECVTSPNELLQEHIRKFKDIKEKSVTISVMKNTEAMTMINSLRKLD